MTKNTHFLCRFIENATISETFRGIHAVWCIQLYVFTIVIIVMVYYTYLERPYFSLFNDIFFILIS